MGENSIDFGWVGFQIFNQRWIRDEAYDRWGISLDLEN